MNNNQTLYDEDFIVLPQITYCCVNSEGKVMGMSDSHRLDIDGCTTVCINELVDHSLMGGLVIDDMEEGSYHFDEERYAEYQKFTEQQTLRAKRDTECFSYINRGKLWYDVTIDTEIKKEEFQKWYQNWLNVTETFEIPDKPEWLV
jgi:hypothetical protein